MQKINVLTALSAFDNLEAHIEAIRQAWKDWESDGDKPEHTNFDDFATRSLGSSEPYYRLIDISNAMGEPV